MNILFDILKLHITRKEMEEIMKTLKIKNLKKIYGKYENEVHAIAGIDLEIEPKSLQQ